MKKINRSIGLLLILLMVFSIVACSSKDLTEKDSVEEVTNSQQNEEQNENKIEESSHYPVTITTYNRAKEPVEITFKKAPERVIAIYQSAIETLLALDQGDKIIAAAYLDDPVKDEYKEEFAKIKYYEKRPTKEEIIGMEPDLITSWYSLFSDKVYGNVEFWHERGINTYIQQNSGVKQPNTLNNEYEDIINMGKIFDAEDKAIVIVENMKKEIQKAKEYVQGKEKVKTVILEVGKEGQYRIYGEDSIGGDIATQVGADLVADKNATIGSEDLVALNPEVIFTVYYGDSIISEKAVKSILDNPALASISAVQNKKVHPIVLSEVYASGVRTLDGIQTIIEGIYPELKGE
jgi:iron complex transport system substrate-binding protein